MMHKPGVALMLAITACSGAPMNYMYGHGPVASSEARLGWWLVIVSGVVVAVVALLVVLGALHRPPARDATALERTGSHGGLIWIYLGGLLIPAVILIVSFGLTLGTLHATARPPADPAATVQIIGHRWWWEVKYVARDPTKTIVTANELHVPVGRPVRLELTSADVIHSFWIPQLAGKTDVIPGQTNLAWLQADSAGVYRGACTEYCGLQHANMAPIVVAESPEKFMEWEEAERASAAKPSDPAAASGLAVFQKSACATCHAIRGSDALGRVGPDLTHLASRLTLAAGTLENTRGNLAGWIGNSQAIKPGNDMPVMTIAPNDLQALLAYLETLK
ncbi:MAG: cytochrome c oxidase subunit II [Gemmatimonadaceae bacterium]